MAYGVHQSSKVTINEEDYQRLILVASMIVMEELSRYQYEDGSERKGGEGALKMCMARANNIFFS